MNSTMQVPENGAIKKTVSNKFAAKNLKQLYLDSNSADVHFVFNANTEQPIRIAAHKSILGAMSPIFYAMFYGSLKEGAEVIIVDAPAEAFEKFLQFFYLADVTLSMEHISRIMYLCEKYQITDCLHTCSTFLGETLPLNTVCMSYGLAEFYNQDQLMKMCDVIIKSKTTTVLQSNDFLKCNKTMLQHILNMDSLNCSYTELLRACMTWAKHSAQQIDSNPDDPVDVRDQLGDLIFELPFCLLTQTEFFEIVPLYKDLFTNEELKELIEIAASESYQPTLFLRKNFREIFDYKNCKINQLQRVSRIIPDSFSVKNVETTIFSSNKLFLLNGILCANVFEFRKPEWRYYVVKIPASKITIHQKKFDDETQDGNNTTLFTGEIQLVTHGENRVNLSSPIIIEPFVKYEIRLEQEIPPSTYIFSTLKSMVPIEPDINIQFHPDPNLDYDNTATGMVTDLLIESL